MSGGERRRCSIGMELLTQPSILLLDEPTSGLDAKSSRLIVELLKKLASEGTLSHFSFFDYHRLWSSSRSSSPLSVALSLLSASLTSVHRSHCHFNDPSAQLASVPIIWQSTLTQPRRAGADSGNICDTHKSTHHICRDLIARILIYCHMSSKKFHTLSLGILRPCQCGGVVLLSVRSAVSLLQR